MDGVTTAEDRAINQAAPSLDASPAEEKPIKSLRVEASSDQPSSSSWSSTMFAKFYEYRDSARGWIDANPQTCFTYTAIAVAAISSPPGLYLLHWVLVLLRVVVGWTVGIGLGLGLASHVYDQVDAWHQSPNADKDRLMSNLSNNSHGRVHSRGTFRRYRSFSRSTSNTTQPQQQDEQTYASLMASAGYLTIKYNNNTSELPLQYQRGQLIPTSEIPTSPRYSFTEGTTAVNCLQTLFPHLPSSIHTSLGKAMELMLRDYVATWYSLVDLGCINPAAAAPTSNTPSSSSSSTTPRTLLTHHLSIHRPIPFLDSVYEIFATVLGNLATRVEHVNLLDLLLTQWPRILAHTFRWYRTARRQQLSTENKLSEYTLARQFLCLHVTHRAVTFGLDVPSWLSSTASTAKDEAEQLQTLLALTDQCALDYHRVLAHRMVRLLLASPLTGGAAASSSVHPVLQSFLTEVLASSVLTPIMAMMGPDSIHGWIVMGLKPSDEATLATDDGTKKEGSKTDYVEADSSNKAQPLESARLDSADTANSDDLISVENDDFDADGITSSPTLGPSKTLDEIVLGDGLMHTLAMTLMELQTHVDLDDCRTGVAATKDVDWDDDECRAAVLKLVLVIESALSHGRCIHVVPAEDTVQQQDLEDSVEVSLPSDTTLTQLFMEMTSDVDAFAERSALAEPLEMEDASVRREDYIATATDQSTLRTLIAAWLHAGEVHRTVSMVADSHLFAPFYHPTAFSRSHNMQGFLRQLRVLGDVHMVVDTMSVLTSPRLEELGEGNDIGLVSRSNVSNPSPTNEAPLLSSVQFLSPSALPRHLDFHRNESFAASLRSERDRRRQSWERIVEDDESTVNSSLMVHHLKGVTDEDISIHSELHHLARVFYAGTNMLALRNAARRTNEEASGVQVSLLTVESAGARRRFEVPDDDSSFLLRAQVCVVLCCRYHVYIKSPFNVPVLLCILHSRVL